jgi:hypothetical protein
VRQISNQPPGPLPGTVSGAGLQTCGPNAPSGSACVAGGGSTIRCSYNDNPNSDEVESQQGAVNCGQFASGEYCLPDTTKPPVTSSTPQTGKHCLSNGDGGYICYDYRTTDSIGERCFLPGPIF